MPFKEIASLFEQRMQEQVNRGIQGVPCVLGTMTATGVILDDFKHEIQDPLVLEPLVDADIELELKIPSHQEEGRLLAKSETDIRITQDGSPESATVGYVTKGEHTAGFNFDTWTYDASSLGNVEVKKARIKFKPQYQPGDRVLCTLINGGQDAVIIARVVPYA